MDPTSARLLDDLKDLLREKVITLAEWRTETAAVHARTLANQAPPAAPPTAPPAPPAAVAPPRPLAVAAEPAPGAGKNARKNAKKRAAKKAKAATAPTASAEAAPPAQPYKGLGFRSKTHLRLYEPFRQRIVAHRVEQRRNNSAGNSSAVAI